ncbi:unnamed protein product [Ixodes persulcatus]
MFELPMTRASRGPFQATWLTSHCSITPKGKENQLRDCRFCCMFVFHHVFVFFYLHTMFLVPQCCCALVAVPCTCMTTGWPNCEKRKRCMLVFGACALILEQHVL